MQREKQTNTSVVYVSTQKHTTQIKYIKNVKLADCTDIKYNNTILYNNLHLDQK